MHFASRHAHHPCSMLCYLQHDDSCSVSAHLWQHCAQPVAAALHSPCVQCTVPAQVNDTDAEGRLTLADAVWFAQEKAGAEVRSAGGG
jgi:Cytosol aminopeptidase family, catalytic domain